METLEKNNLTIALNILYIKKKGICPAYISNINSNCVKQIVLSMISNKKDEGWNYLAAKRLSALLRGITSKKNGDFYCLNCLRFLKTGNKIKSMKKKNVKRKIFLEL